MKAIVTKYLPPTNVKGSRIKASAEGVPSVIISYPHEASNAHREAALILCRKYRWSEDIVGGGLPDQTGECFVFVQEMAKALRAVEACREDFQSGKRDGGTMGAVSAAMDVCKEALCA